jgi:hypothetical protein
MTSVSTLARSCPLRGWFFQRYREPLSLAVRHRPLSNDSSQLGGISTCPNPQINRPQPQYNHCLGLAALPSGFCQPFNAHSSGILGRFSPIRF